MRSDAPGSAALAGVDQPSHRWLEAGCLAAIVPDLRRLLRNVLGRYPEPSAANFDGRTVQCLVTVIRIQN